MESVLILNGTSYMWLNVYNLKNKNKKKNLKEDKKWKWILIILYATVVKL